MTQLHKFPIHVITSTTSSDVDIVIKMATQWSNTDLKALNVMCDILCDIDMILCYMFSAMKTASLV